MLCTFALHTATWCTPLIRTWFQDDRFVHEIDTLFQLGIYVLISVLWTKSLCLKVETEGLLASALCCGYNKTHMWSIQPFCRAIVRLIVWPRILRCDRCGTIVLSNCTISRSTSPQSIQSGQRRSQNMDHQLCSPMSVFFLYLLFVFDIFYQNKSIQYGFAPYLLGSCAFLYLNMASVFLDKNKIL